MRFFRPLLALLAISTIGCKQDPQKPPPPAPPAPPPATTPATTRAATKPTTAAAEKKKFTYLEVARAARPALAEVEPVVIPVTLKEAARFTVSAPVYLDVEGHLWITQADAPAGEEISRQAMEQSENEHVLRDRVVFAWWIPDRSGQWVPLLIVPANSGSGLQFVTPTRRTPFGHRSDYHWAKARVWNEGNTHRLAVPTEHGISVFTYLSMREPPQEQHQDLAALDQNTTAPTTAPATAPASTEPTGDTASRPQFVFALRGLIAWIPPGACPGSNGAAWYVEGAWKPLTPAAGWPRGIIHLIPLLDGTVAQILANDAGVRLAFTTLGESTAVDAKAILDLVNQLGEDDADRRDRAYKQLAAYGPGALPVLQNVKQDDVNPEAWARLRRLLRAPAVPLLGGIGMRPDRLRLVRRLRDGGVLFYTPDEITLPNPAGDEPLKRTPGWIVARPGRMVEPLDPNLAFDANPDDPKMDVVSGQWIVDSEKFGPRLFQEPNTFKRMLQADQREYSYVVGLDRRGRWLFRRLADAEISATSSGSTLIVDPTLPDPTPRLPIWVFDNNEGMKVGWDKENWPAVNDGNLERRLMKDEWEPLADGDVIHTDPPPRPAAPPVPPPATTRAASTQPAEELPPPLLIDASGKRYYNGISALRVIGKDGTDTNWLLPAEAIGAVDYPTTLIQTHDGRLYLLNQANHVVRLKPTPKGVEPYVLEGVLTPNLPAEESPVRSWLDPAGRIIIAYEHKLAILFPGGYIPQAIRERMVNTDDDD